MTIVVVIDPGVYKCGLLLANIKEYLILDGKVVKENAVINCLDTWKSKATFSRLLMGNGTTSKYWSIQLKDFAHIQLIEEKGSTLRARSRYWELWPPSPLMKLIPKGLRLPPENLDAIAALILLEDYMDRKFHWSGPSNFRIEP